MTGPARRPAFFAVARGIASHRLLKNEKHPLSRREALEWLFEAAAYRPMGQRLSHGVADVKRGQVATTIRGLATAWRWPRWRVEYFLRLLKEDGTVVTEAIPTKIQTNSMARNSYCATVITICNYDIYQGALKASEGGTFRQSAVDRFRQSLPQLPGIVQETTTEQSQPLESIEKQEAVTKGLRSLKYVDKSKPHHGARNRKAGVRWWDYATIEWRAAVEFDREMRGTETYPVRYRDGRGNWFKERGEAEWREWGRRVSGRR